MSTGPQQSDEHHSQKEEIVNEDLTPQNANSKLLTEQLTSFSRKKSFEVQEEKHEDLLDEEEFLKLEKQISSHQAQQRIDNLVQEETKSRRSENQSMKGVSFATSDTEEKKSNYDPTPASKKMKKKRLSRVEEELKQINNPLKDNQSEQLHVNKSNATSVRETKSSKKKEESKQDSQTHKKRQKASRKVEQTIIDSIMQQQNLLYSQQTPHQVQVQQQIQTIVWLKNEIEQIQKENQLLSEEIQKQSDFQDQIVNESLKQQINQRRLELQEDKILSSTQQDQIEDALKDDQAKQATDNEQESSVPRINIPQSEDQKTEDSKPVLDNQSEIPKVDEIKTQEYSSKAIYNA